MARYVLLIRFTDQGAKNINKSAERAATFKKSAEEAGLTVETQLWTLGAYDGLVILSGDEKKVLRSIAQLGTQGNIRTQTLQAFDAKEFQALTG
jgi:uncharacterized protein with GYD domain